MESSIAEFLGKWLACEQSLTNKGLDYNSPEGVHAQCGCAYAVAGRFCKLWQMGSAMLRSMVLGTVAGLECCILNGGARPKHTCVNSSLHSPCECTSPHAYAAESNNKSNGNKYAASEDRAHDLKIIRPTRCQLRYRR